MTDYLFARRSFLSGVGSIVDLAGAPHLYARWPTESEADAWAMLSDWVVVGKDLRSAMDALASQHERGV